MMTALLLALSFEVAVGAAAPDFALPDGNGKIHGLAESRGQTTVVFFYRGHW